MLGKLKKIGKKIGKATKAGVRHVLDRPADDPLRAAVEAVPGVGQVVKAVDLATKLRGMIPPETLEGLTKGELWIPGGALEAGLRRVVPREVPLKALTCRVEGIEVTVGVTRMGASGEAMALLAIEQLVVSLDRQELVVVVKDMTLVGTNWLGWVVAPLVRVLLWRVYGDKLVEMAAEADVEVTKDPADPHRFVVGLSNFPQIRKLKEKALLGYSVLKFVEIGSCRHADGGIYLKGRARLPSGEEKLTPNI